MKIEANGWGRRGVVFTFATNSAAAIISEIARGDGLNLRPNA
jgi:hypothetical protein